MASVLSSALPARHRLIRGVRPLHPPQKTLMKHLLVIALAATLLAGCTPPTPVLTVINASPSTLTNIVASGSGFSVPLGSLAPGSQSQVMVNPQPRDHPGFTLNFDADGKHFSDVNPNKSFRAMKEVMMTVTSDFSVTYECVTTF